MSLSGDIISDMELDASIEAIGEIAGSINLDGSGSTPTITASATVSPDPGIPYCDVVKTGTDEYPNFAFNFSGLKGEQGEQGVQGIPGQDGTNGTDGVTPDISATASITNTSGVPSVTVTKTGTDEAPNFAFAFENLKGEQGIQGEQGVQGAPGQDGTYPDITATASVDQTTGIPSVVVTRSGTEDEPNFDFAFSNLKGAQGDQGVPGRDGTDGVNGADGVTPLISASGSVDNNVGIPNVVITRSGTEAAPNFDFAFHNLKGDPGTNGVPTGGTAGQVLTKSSSVDYDCAWDSLVIPSTAAEISFDNTGTGMTATDVQDAVTELKSNLTELPYYQDGDTFTVGISYLIGMVNSNNKSLGLTIVTPKIIPDDFTVTVSGSVNNLRQFGSSGAVTSGITIDTPYRRGDNVIFQSITFTTSLTAFAGACVVPNSLVYTFHEPT